MTLAYHVIVVCVVGCCLSEPVHLFFTTWVTFTFRGSSPIRLFANVLRSNAKLLD